MQWVALFCRVGLASLCLSSVSFVSIVCADSNSDGGSVSTSPEGALSDYSIAKEADELLDSVIIDETSDSDSSDDGIDDLDDLDEVDGSADDSNTNVTSGADKASTESKDYSLKITQPPHILSLVLCVPDHDKSIAETDFHARRVLLGPLSRTQGRELIASIRSTRRPSCYNLQFFNYIKQQRENNESIQVCCHTQHCDEGQYCHVLSSPVSLAEGTVVSVCVPDKIDP
ncbi:MAG TPA: hypothetical protein DCL40_01985 [Coxiellaceae bacterium]|nr:hypothetical protein [Coxiellaceae bacterium]